MSSSPLRLAVVGAGVTGLAAAHRALELGRERGRPVEVEVFEASDAVGGVIRTRLDRGFLIEEGPDCFLTEKPWAQELAFRLDLGDRLVSTRPEHRKSFIVREGRLVPTPLGFQLLAPTRLFSFLTTPLLSARGKFRAALEPTVKPRSEPGDESLAAFVERRFGRELLERMAEPMVAGIYGAEAERLSLDATFPRFRELERSHGSVIRGLRATRKASGRRASGARYHLFASFDAGMQVLPRTLAAALPEHAIRLGTKVEGLAPAAAGGWAVRSGGDEEIFDAVVLALPAPAAAGVVRSFDAGLATGLGAIPYGSAATVNLGYRVEDVRHPLDGTGFVVPRVEGLGILGCTFSHRKFLCRAPEGHALLRAYVSGEAVELSDLDLADGVREELEPLLGLRGSPALARIARWRDALPQYPVGHVDHVARLRVTASGHAGLALAGNAYDGVGIPDCVRSGEAAVEGLLGVPSP